MKGDRVKLTFPIVERTVKTKLGGRLYTLVIKGNEVVSIDPPGKHYPYYQRDHYRGASAMNCYTLDRNSLLRYGLRLVFSSNSSTLLRQRSEERQLSESRVSSL